MTSLLSTHPKSPNVHPLPSMTLPSSSSYPVILPSHKADKFFEGNTIVLMKQPYPNLPTFHHFNNYLSSRDRLFPFSSPLWLSCTFFMTRLHQFFSNDVAGQSMRAGGATDLCGSPPSLVQASGRWTSESFQIYVRKNPYLICLSTCTTFASFC
jgi:hypothetical protein